MAIFSYTNDSGIVGLDDDVEMQTVNVYGAQGRIADVSVLLSKLDHTWSEDLDLLLARPNGDNFLFLSDIGCSDDFLGDYLFTDSGTALTSVDDFYLAPPGGIIPEGNLPTDVDSEFGATIGPLNHADANLPHTFASTFGGGIPDGTWALFVLDEALNDLANLDAWTLNIEVDVDVGRIVGLAGSVNTITVSSDNSTDGSWDFNGSVVDFAGVTGFLLGGGALDDTITGGDGDDTISGGAGADVMVGGGGDDTATYQFSTADVVVSLGTAANNLGDALGDTYSSINNVIGGDGYDDITGNAADNLLTGGSVGRDTLQGRKGEDTLEGGTGNDVMQGGADADVIDGGTGSDRADYRDTGSSIVVDLEDPTQNTGIALGDTYISVENLSGSNTGSDTLSGTDGDNLILGYGGSDLIFGRDGDDEIKGGSGSDVINGDAGADELLGGNGDDTINGGAGNDTLTGGAHSDTFLFSGDLTWMVEQVSDYDLSEDILEFSASTGITSLSDLDIVMGLSSAVVNDLQGAFTIFLFGVGPIDFPFLNTDEWIFSA